MKLLILLLLFPACVMAQNNILPPLGLPKPVSIDSPSSNSEPVPSSININYHITRFTGEDKLIEQNYETSVILGQNFEAKQTEDFTINQTLLPLVDKGYFLNYNLQYGIVETSGSLYVEKNKPYLVYRQKGLKIIAEIK